MRKAVAALFLTLFTFVAYGDDAPAMLWIAEGDSNRVYLLGSIHLLREKDHPLPDIVEVVYDDAERLIMEIDMDDLDPLAALQFLTQNGVLEGDTTLRDVMGEKQYAEVVAAAAEIDIPIEMLEKSEPWLAAMTVHEMMMMRIGFKAEFGIEMYLMAKAAHDGKPITGLETVEQQLGFLNDLSPDTQSRWLLQSIVEGKRMEMLIDEMVAAWRNGDVQFLEKELLLEMDGFPELRNALLIDRNKSWVMPIMDLLDDRDDYLVIVGAAHLVGEDGVPDLLSKRGVRIRQLNESLR